MIWSFQPVWPWGVLVLIALLLLGATAVGARLLLQRNILPVWIGRLTVLRVVAIILFLLCLLRPALHYESMKELRSDRLILLDTSASMALEDAAAGGSRLEDVRRMLREPGVKRHVLESFENHWFAFDSHARPLQENEWSSLAATGMSTRIGSALEEAYDIWRWSSDDQNTAKALPRILLISDGVDRGQRDALVVALQAGMVIDVLAPAIAPEAVEPQAEIPDLQHTQRLLQGSELRIQVTVRQQGMAGRPLRLVLESEGQPLHSRTLKFPAHQNEQRLTLNTRPESAGVHSYRLRLEADDEKSAEEAQSFAVREFTVRVESQHHEVLMIEPEWRWEFRHLRRVLEGDPGFAFSAFLSRGPGVFIQFGEPHRRVNPGGFPRSQAELEGFDTFILGDANPARLPPQLPDALYHLVVQQGRSLVVVAGPNIAAWSRHPRLSALLPVDLYAASSGAQEGPVPVQISLEGLNSAFFFVPEGAPSVRQWPALPPMEQIYAPLRKKPAATVLIEAPAHQNEFGPLIVAAVHTIGRGQVLYLATDTLWKWQMQGVMDADGNTPYRLFWQQAMRAIRPERLHTSQGNLWLHPDRTQVQTGRRVTVHARTDGDASNQDLRVQGQIQRPGGQTLPMIFNRDTASPELYSSSFVATETGVYTISAETVIDEQSAGETWTTVTALEAPLESESSPPNFAWLEQLAGGSGGSMITPSIIEKGLFEDVPPPVRARHEVTLDFWSSLLLILALTMVLGSDWLLRLMRGYA